MLRTFPLNEETSEDDNGIEQKPSEFRSELLAIRDLLERKNPKLPNSTPPMAIPGSPVTGRRKTPQPSNGLLYR